MRNKDHILLQQEMVTELDEVFGAYDERFEDDPMQASITLLNFAVKSVLFKTDPLIASELVSSSLAAWMSFARKLSQEEEGETVTVYSFDDTELSPELLFFDTDDEKPN